MSAKTSVTSAFVFALYGTTVLSLAAAGPPSHRSFDNWKRPEGSVSIQVRVERSAGPGAVLDQVQEDDSGAGAIWAERHFAQTFTPAIGGQLAQVDLLITSTGDPTYPATISIVETAGGVPTGAVLGSVHVPGFVWGWNWVDLLPASVFLVAETQYGIIFANDDSDFLADPTDWWAIKWETNPYPRGEIWEWLPASGWQQMGGLGPPGTSDMAFRTWMISGQIAPPNDLCPNAICVADGIPMGGSNVNASGSGGTGCDTGFPVDVWYHYTPTVSETVNISLCGGASFDTILSVHDVCNGLALACDDEGCGTAQSELSLGMTAGTTYLIRVDGFGEASGPFTLTVSGGGGTCYPGCDLPPALVNPDPSAGATEVPVDTGLSWNGATAALMVVPDKSGDTSLTRLPTTGYVMVDDVERPVHELGPSTPAHGARAVLTEGPVTDTVGSQRSGVTGAARIKGNFFACTSSTTLVESEFYLDISTPTELRFFVYEAETRTSAGFSKISDVLVSSSGTGVHFYSSGAINVPLLAGKSYAIGVGWAGTARYWFDTGHPTPTAFGESYDGLASVGFPPPVTVIYEDDSAQYYQRLTTDSDAVPCPTTYDVYLGTNPGAMDLICDDVAEPTCDPGVLAGGTTYHWQVIAKNNGGEAPGSVWSFTTYGELLVRLTPVVLQNPSGSNVTVGSPPAGDPDVVEGSPFALELWAQQVDPNLGGLQCVFSDLSFDSSTMACVDPTPSPAFNVLTAGTCTPGGVDELGGCGFSTGVGIAPEWVLVATVEMNADVASVGNVVLSNTAATSISISSFGNVPVDQIDFEASAPFEIVGQGAGACCLPGETCSSDLAESECITSGGRYLGDDLTCAGDPDHDGVIGCDDICPSTSAPAGVDSQGRPLGDLDEDCDVDLTDFRIMQVNFSGPKS